MRRPLKPRKPRKKRKNAHAVAMGKKRARGADMSAVASLGGQAAAAKGVSGRRPVETACPRCGEVCPSARVAWMHCRKKRESDGE